MPAIAIGEELMRQHPDTELLFVGTTVGMDREIYSKTGFRFELLEARGIRGHSLVERARAVFDFVGAVRQASRVVSGFAPALVVGVGGYASAAASAAAVLRRIPLVLVEQNTRPGLANSLLSRFAKKICVPFDESKHFFKNDKVIVTGTPLRFKAVPNGVPHPSEPLQILVLGGSSGAHRLNVGVVQAFKNLGKNVIKYAIVHQTGPHDEDLVRGGYAETGLEAKVTPFIDQMAEAYGRADLIIARAGGNTVSEIALAGRPAILVPYPFHPDRQQEHNARVLENLGAAILMHDDDHLADNLTRELSALRRDRDRLRSMGEKAKIAARPDAASAIARTCLDLASGAAA